MVPIVAIFTTITNLNINTNIIYIIVTAISLIATFIKSKCRVNSKYVFFVISITTLISINYFLQDYSSIFAKEIFNIIQFIIIPLYLVTNIEDLDKFLIYWYRISIFVFISFIIFKDSITISYMGLGIYMQLCFISILINYYKHDRIIDICLCLFYICLYLYIWRKSKYIRYDYNDCLLYHE